MKVFTLFPLKVAVIFLLLIGVGANSQADESRKSQTTALGLKLESQYWTLVQKKDVKGFSRKIAPIFQGLNAQGAYTRSQQISGLANANLVSFSLDNPVVTRFRDVLVISYNFTAVGTGLTSGPSITVWQIECGCWKIVSHSYFPFLTPI